MRRHGCAGGGRGWARGRHRQRGGEQTNACTRRTAPPPIAPRPAGAEPPKEWPEAPGYGTEELPQLKQRAQAVEQELAAVQLRLAARRQVAVINQAYCTLCGICASSCLYDAIRIGAVVEVDASRCLGCGACAYACPADGIRLETIESLP